MPIVTKKDKKLSSMTGMDLKNLIKINLVKAMAETKRLTQVTEKVFRNVEVLHTGTGRGPKTARILRMPDPK